MTYTITKRFRFAASHVLKGLPEGHKCGRLHGHNYEVVVELASHTLDVTGFVVDYGDLAPFRDGLMEAFDHRHLNDVLADGRGPTNPTAEVLAGLLYAVAREVLGPMVRAVTVCETPDTTATFRP